MKVGIVGANGYSGVELIRLLQQHPYVTIEKIVSHSTHGKNILELYPHLYGVNEMILEKWNLDELSNLDFVFLRHRPGFQKISFRRFWIKELLVSIFQVTFG